MPKAKTKKMQITIEFEVDANLTKKQEKILTEIGFACFVQLEGLTDDHGIGYSNESWSLKEVKTKKEIRDELKNMRPLDTDEMNELDLDEYSTQEIRYMIDCGTITEDFVIAYFKNEWWEDVPE